MTGEAVCEMLTCSLFFACTDVAINPPDEQSIMTYVSQFLEHFPGFEEVGVPSYVAWMICV